MVISFLGYYVIFLNLFNFFLVITVFTPNFHMGDHFTKDSMFVDVVDNGLACVVSGHFRLQVTMMNRSATQRLAMAWLHLGHSSLQLLKKL